MRYMVPAVHPGRTTQNSDSMEKKTRGIQIMKVK